MADRHASHDLEAIVAFADGELAGPELASAATQVEGCPACDELVADLRSLALADRDLATPLRPRDFRLTPADAERLARLGPEPLVMAARLGTEMPATPTAHADHDPERIAAAVGGAVEPAERAMIESWLATCSSCAELHADLIAIASAERALLTPSRTRDFQLTPADAHRLRPGGWRAVLAAIGSSRDAFSKPLAVGLTTLGLAGLLVGTVPSLGIGGSATSLSAAGAAVGDTAKSGEPNVRSETYSDGSPIGGQDAGQSAAPSAAAAAAPELAEPSAAAPAPGVAAPAAGSEAPREVTDNSASSSSTEDRQLLASEAERLSAAGAGPPPLVIVSLVLLLAGIGLFIARWGARRLRGS